MLRALIIGGASVVVGVPVLAYTTVVLFALAISRESRGAGCAGCAALEAHDHRVPAGEPAAA